MSTWQWIGAVLGAWVVLGCAVGPVIGRALRRAADALNPGDPS